MSGWGQPLFSQALEQSDVQSSDLMVSHVPVSWLTPVPRFQFLIPRYLTGMMLDIDRQPSSNSYIIIHSIKVARLITDWA